MKLSSYYLAIACGLLLSVAMAKSSPHERPKDQDLVTLFYQKQEPLKRLIVLLHEDEGRVWYISEDAIRENGLPSSRVAEYLGLLRKLGSGVIIRPGDGEIWISFWNKGESAIGQESEKGIAYLPHIERRRYERRPSLDSVPDMKEGIFIRAIEGGWYVTCTNSS